MKSIKIKTQTTTEVLIEDKHYCPDCYIYNEETDEYIAKS